MPHARLCLSFAATVLPLLATACVGPEEKQPPVFDRLDCPLATERFRIDRIEGPRSTEDADAQGLDLDGDGEPDNALGGLVASLNATAETADQTAAQMTSRIESGQLSWTLMVSSCIDDPSLAEVALSRDGDETGLPSPAIGTIAAGRLRAQAGEAMAPVSAFVDPLAAVPIEWVAGLGLTVDLRRLPDGGWAGRVGLGLQGDVSKSIAPSIAAFLATDAGQEWVAYFDADEDGRATATEVHDSPLLVASSGNPDLDLLVRRDGELLYWPGQDAVKDSLSFGCQIER